MIRITNASVLIDTRKLPPIRSQHAGTPHHSWKRTAGLGLMAVSFACVVLVAGVRVLHNG